MTIELSHCLFVENSQYYTGCAWPTVLGVGSTPHEALEDAITHGCEEAAFMATGKEGEITVALHDYDNDEPDEPGELAEIEGWDADGCELSWHCELTIGGD